VQGASTDSGIDSVAASLVASVLFAILVFLGERIQSTSAKRNPSYRRVRLMGIVSIGVVLDVASTIFLTKGWLAICLLSTSIVMGLAIYRELNQFWQIGIVGADREVGKGVDYRAALGMCHHSFRFLGIGASKLTQDQKAFRDAIDRCSRTAPVKLLLGRPEANELIKFAQMAGKPKDAYQQTVRESLRFIAKLRDLEQKNISVRFYKAIPAFRLMFIDEAICLMSYYLMGKGDGSNLPQLHIIKAAGSTDTGSLYFAFTEYFDKMWDDSEDCDLKEYL
jgi:hypothetical protein